MNEYIWNRMDELMRLCGVIIGVMTKISAMEILRRIRFRLAKKKDTGTYLNWYLKDLTGTGTYLSLGQVGWNGRRKEWEWEWEGKEGRKMREGGRERKEREGRKEGRKEGREEGREEGRKEGRKEGKER